MTFDEKLDHLALAGERARKFERALAVLMARWPEARPALAVIGQTFRAQADTVVALIALVRSYEDRLEEARSGKQRNTDDVR